MVHHAVDDIILPDNNKMSAEDEAHISIDSKNRCSQYIRDI